MITTNLPKIIRIPTTIDIFYTTTQLTGEVIQI